MHTENMTYKNCLKKRTREEMRIQILHDLQCAGIINRRKNTKGLNSTAKMTQKEEVVDHSYPNLKKKNPQ